MMTKQHFIWLGVGAIALGFILMRKTKSAPASTGFSMGEPGDINNESPIDYTIGSEYGGYFGF